MILPNFPSEIPRWRPYFKMAANDMTFFIKKHYKHSKFDLQISDWALLFFAIIDLTLLNFPSENQDGGLFYPRPLPGPEGIVVTCAVCPSVCPSVRLSVRTFLRVSDR